MNYRILQLASVLVIALSGCAGPNPNPGERTTDMAWTSNNYRSAFEIAKPYAEAGKPWAQLRLGIFYENGWGTDKDKAMAEYWYKKAVAQIGTGDWAEGKVVGAVGEAGFFNQNSDSRIARFNLAQLYYYSDKNLQEAKELIDSVIQESGGNGIFFCCEFSGGRSFSHEQFVELRQKIESKLNDR